MSKQSLSLAFVANDFTPLMKENLRLLKKQLKQVLVVDAGGFVGPTVFAGLPIQVIKPSSEKIDFAAWRNLAIQRCQTDWLFFLDSDERLSLELANLLPSLLKQTKIRGFYFRRIDIFHQRRLRFGEVGRVYKLRLARRDAWRFIGRVHEQALLAGAGRRLAAPIYHYPHQSIDSFWEKIGFYSRLAAAEKRLSAIGVLWQLMLYPGVKFVINYLFKLGFLDGYPGLIYALMMSCHSAAVRIFAYEKNHRQI